MTNRIKISSWLARVSLAMYVICLFLPAYRTTERQQHLGIEALLAGPWGIFSGHFSWLANLFLLLSFTKRAGQTRQRPLLLSTVALLLALTFLLKEDIPVGVQGYFSYSAGVGYYVWLSSIALAVLAAYLSSTPAEIPSNAS